MKNKITILLILLTSVQNINLSGKSKDLNLKECLKIALNNHPTLFELKEDKKKSIAQYNLINAYKDIQVSGEIKTIERLKSGVSANNLVNVPGKDTDIGIFAGIAASYKLYDPKASEEETKAKITLIRAKLYSQKVKNNIIFNVKQAFYNYLIAEKKKILSNKLLNNFIKKKKQAELFFKNGLKPILDVSKADVAVAEAMMDYEQAKNQESIAKINLFTAMGLKNDEIDITPRERYDFPVLKYSFEQIFKLSKMYNSELRTLELDKRAKKLTIAIEKSANIPTVYAEFSLGYELKKIYGLVANESLSSNYDTSKWEAFFGFSFRATLPLYTGGAISAKVNNSIADYNKSVYREREATISIKNKILSYYKEIKVFDEKFIIANLIIKNSKKHLLHAQRSYEHGTASQLDLQNAEMGMLKAEIKQITTKYNYLLAIARLSSIVGIGEGYLCKTQNQKK